MLTVARVIEGQSVKPESWNFRAAKTFMVAPIEPTDERRMKARRNSAVSCIFQMNFSNFQFFSNAAAQIEIFHAVITFRLA